MADQAQTADRRPYTLGEEIANSLTHGLGTALAIAALVILVAFAALSDDGYKLASAIVYGITLMLLYAASTLYHALPQPRVKHLFKILDHCSIYLLIAGTYTPFCVNAFEGFWKWGMLGIIWSLALIGIIVKVFYIRAPRWLNAGIYLVMGWLAVSASGQMLSALPAWVLGWMIAGGVIYTLGALVYITKIFNFKPGVFGFHEMWHIFVLLAAAAHFVAVLGVAL